MKAPVLTFPALEAEAVALAYRDARVILEYGSGGSTVLAGKTAGASVFSVESDAKWLADLQGYFDAEPPVAKVTLHHGDIGPTREWGQPVDSKAFHKWPSYALSVWERLDFQRPDVVLIDGRFRPACFLTTLYRCQAPVTVLWDDYIDRQPYHKVEELVRPTALIGRMAVFDLVPTPFPVDRLGWIIETYLRPA